MAKNDLAGNISKARRERLIAEMGDSAHHEVEQRSVVCAWLGVCGGACE